MSRRQHHHLHQFFRADFECEQNPDARLEQLRRSSLVEIEHLTKDPHPDPPLRALPEHSVLEDENTSVAHLARSGSTSSHGLEGTVSQSSTQTSHRVTSDQLEASGIARVDFAQSVDTSSESVSKSGDQSEGLFFTSQGLSSTKSGDQSEGLFFTSQGLSSDKSGDQSEGLSFTSQGLSSGNSSWSTQNISSSTSQHFSSSQHSSTTQQTSSSGGQQIQSGRTTFTLPDFGKDIQTDVANKQEDVLSPTQAAEEEEAKKGQGLF
jgi:glycogenin glucosyltransferase